MPLPNTKVIGAGWSAHHRPTAEGGMTADCVITRADGDGTLNPDGTWTSPATTTVYTGRCRVQPRPTEERVVVIGERRVTVRRYLVAVEHDTAEVLVDDMWEGTACPGDPSLVGRQLRVIDVLYASEVWERDLLCEEQLEGSA